MTTRHWRASASGSRGRRAAGRSRRATGRGRGRGRWTPPPICCSSTAPAPRTSDPRARGSWRTRKTLRRENPGTFAREGLSWRRPPLTPPPRPARAPQVSINVTLNARRYELNKLELLLAVASFAVGVGGMWAGIFGMNFLNGGEQSKLAFYSAMTLICAGVVAVFHRLARCAGGSVFSRVVLCHSQSGIGGVSKQATIRNRGKGGVAPSMLLTREFSRCTRLQIHGPESTDLTGCRLMNEDSCRRPKKTSAFFWLALPALVLAAATANRRRA